MGRDGDREASDVEEKNRLGRKNEITEGREGSGMRRKMRKERGKKGKRKGGGKKGLVREEGEI